MPDLPVPPLTRSWRPTIHGGLAVAGLLAVGVASVNDQGNGPWLFALWLIFSGLCAGWWNARRLDALHLRLSASVPMRPVGTPRDVDVVFHGLTAVEAAVMVRTADGHDLMGPSTMLRSPGGRVALPDLPVGVHQVLGFATATRWPWGWFCSRRHVDLLAEVVVHPAPAGDGVQALAAAGDDEFHGLRPWRPGDRLTRIAWRRSDDRLMVKDFTGGPPTVLTWDDHDGPAEERLAALATRVMANTGPVGLILPWSRREPGIGMAHREACLRDLARVPRHLLTHGTTVPIPPPTQPQPLPRRTLGLLLATLVIGTFGLAPVLPVWLLVAGPALGAVRWILALRGWTPVPPTLRWALLLGMIGLLALEGRLGFGVDGALPVFIALLWTKVLELDRDREIHLIAVLALFTAGATLLLDGGLGRFLLAVTAAGLTGLALMRHHGHRPADGWLLLRPLGLGLVLAALVFLLVPRPSAAMTGLGQGNAATGVSAILTPTSIARNLNDETPAFRATLNDPSVAVHDLYWRALILWETDGHAWRQGVEPFPIRSPRVVPGPTARPVQARLSLQPGAAWPPALAAMDRAPPGLDLLLGGALRWARGAERSGTYELTADLGAFDGQGGPTAMVWALGLPEGLDPRIGDLGRSLMGDSPENTAERVTRWFLDQGFAYTMEPGSVEGGTAGFLFGTRRGFCAHFAAAGATLLRAAGTPARVVVGWRGGEWNPIGGYVLVRQLHAHAWVEYWTGHDTGWRRLDLTDLVPSIDLATGQTVARTGPQVAGNGGNLSWWDVLLQVPDYIASRWDALVQGYDAERRAQVMARLGDELPRLGGVLGLVGLSLTAWWRLHRWRQRPPPAERAAASFHAALARHGVPRLPGEGPRDHARRAAVALPGLAETIRTGSEAQLRLLYAAAPEADDLTVLQRAARRLRQAS